MKLVKYICGARAHADGRSESALTIHQGAWAFCPMGGDATGHDWKPSDGLPLPEAMRLTTRQQAAAAAAVAATEPAKPAPPAAAKGKSKPR
ncbi:MAG: hypothetical protein M3O64_06665 [Chloroflexota bacterium]|nr:hypothetical protein [Chloroflexota bacterium]